VKNRPPGVPAGYYIFANLKFRNILNGDIIRLRHHKKIILKFSVTVSWTVGPLFWQDKSIHVYETTAKEEFVKSPHENKTGVAKIFCKKIRVNKKGKPGKGNYRVKNILTGRKKKKIRKHV
jgi:hypothetical protein